MENLRTIPALLAAVAAALLLLLAALPANAQNCARNPDHHRCSGGGDDPGDGDDGGGDGGGASPFKPAIVHTVGFNFSRVDLYLLNQDGSESSVLLEGARSLGYRGPSWSPDGDAIAFQHNSSGLWTIDIDGSNMVQRYEVGDAKKDNESAIGRVAWHPRGWIAFGVSYTTADQPRGVFDVFVVADTDSVSDQLTNLTGDFLGPTDLGIDEPLSLEVDPTWSPDGDRLAMRRLVDMSWPGLAQIVVCRFEDQVQPRLDCEWEDDGYETKPRPLAQAIQLSVPAWHPADDVDRIAYASAPREIAGNKPMTELFITNLMGECEKVLIAGNSNGSDDAGLCPVTFAVSGLTEFFRSVSWSCDGDSLIVEANGAHGRGLYKVSGFELPAVEVSPLRFPERNERGVGSAESRRGCG